MRWFRVYSEMLDDEKVQMLSPELFKTWMNLLCVASTRDGILPPVDKLAFKLRVSKTEMQSRIEDLILSGLIDIRSDKKYEPHNWKQRQWVSDDSADRVRKHRAKTRNGDVTVTVTPPDSDTESDTETDKNFTSQIAQASQSAGFKNIGFIGSGGRGVSPRLKTRAEGLGLPVDEMVKLCAQPIVKSQNAYFRHLAVEHLQKMLPRADRKMLAAALTVAGDGAFGKVCQMILETTP